MQILLNKISLTGCKWSNLDPPGSGNPVSHSLLEIESSLFQFSALQYKEIVYNGRLGNGHTANAILRWKKRWSIFFGIGPDQRCRRRRRDATPGNARQSAEASFAFASDRSLKVCYDRSLTNAKLASARKTDSDPVLRGTVVFNSRRTRSCGVPCL